MSLRSIEQSPKSSIRFGSEQRQQPEYVASPEEPTKRAIEFEPILSGKLKMKSHDSEEHEQHTHRSPARSSEITLIDASLDPKDSPYEQIIEGGRKIIRPKENLQKREQK